MVEDAEQPELQNRFVFVNHEFIFLLFKVDILLLHQSTTFKNCEDRIGTAVELIREMRICEDLKRAQGGWQGGDWELESNSASELMILYSLTIIAKWGKHLLMYLTKSNKNSLKL